MSQSSALSRATFAYDQCLACVDEISIRAPDAMSFAVRPGPEGPLQSEGGVIPKMRPGEWEIIRKLAQLGWAHFSVQLLTRIEEERREEGG